MDLDFAAKQALNFFKEQGWDAPPTRLVAPSIPEFGRQFRQQQLKMKRALAQGLITFSHPTLADESGGKRQELTPNKPNQDSSNKSNHQNPSLPPIHKQGNAEMYSFPKQLARKLAMLHPGVLDSLLQFWALVGSGPKRLGSHLKLKHSGLKQHYKYKSS